MLESTKCTKRVLFEYRVLAYETYVKFLYFYLVIFRRFVVPLLVFIFFFYDFTALQRFSDRPTFPLPHPAPTILRYHGQVLFLVLYFFCFSLVFQSFPFFGLLNSVHVSHRHNYSELTDAYPNRNSDYFPRRNNGWRTF